MRCMKEIMLETYLVQGAFEKFLTGENLKFFSCDEAKMSCNTGIEREFCGLSEDVRC